MRKLSSTPPPSLQLPPASRKLVAARLISGITSPAVGIHRPGFTGADDRLLGALTAGDRAGDALLLGARLGDCLSAVLMVQLTVSGKTAAAVSSCRRLTVMAFPFVRGGLKGECRG